jgi:hypothetical protein
MLGNEWLSANNGRRRSSVSNGTSNTSNNVHCERWWNALIAVVGFDVAALLYWTSLEPQESLEELHRNLPRLASCLMASSFLFLFSFLYTIARFSAPARRYSPLSTSPTSSFSPVLAPSSSSASSFDIPQRRNAGGRGHRRGAIGWGVLVYGAILLTCLLLVDQGNTLERHGGFNQLLFLIFFLPCLVLSLAVRYGCVDFFLISLQTCCLLRTTQAFR